MDDSVAPLLRNFRPDFEERYSQIAFFVCLRRLFQRAPVISSGGGLTRGLAGRLAAAP